MHCGVLLQHNSQECCFLISSWTCYNFLDVFIDLKSGPRSKWSSTQRQTLTPWFCFWFFFTPLSPTYVFVVTVVLFLGFWPPSFREPHGFWMPDLPTKRGTTVHQRRGCRSCPPYPGVRPSGVHPQDRTNQYERTNICDFFLVRTQTRTIKL